MPFFRAPPWCHTGDHLTHEHVPWWWEKPYDKTCYLCQHPASQEYGSGDGATHLCDCCAEDWSEWSDAHPGWRSSLTDLDTIEMLQNEKELNRVWWVAFQSFVDEREKEAEIW